MNLTPNDPFLEFPPNVVYEVRKKFNLEKPGEMNAAVKILEEWVQKQSHFIKKDFRKEYLENSIIMCKGSVEKVKRQLEKICTYKTHVPKFFAYTNIKEEMAEILEKLCLIAVPKLDSDLSRTFIVQVKTTDFNPVGLTKFYAILVILTEYIKIHDCCLSFLLVFDYRNIQVKELMLKIDLVEIQQFVPICIEGYGIRLKGLIFITKSKIIHGFIKIFKTFVSEKIGNRIHVCSDLEAFYGFTTKEFLPIEYGGTDKSEKVINDIIVETLSSKEHVEYMKEIKEAKVDETKRPPDMFNEQCMGMAGTFRNLHVD